MNDFLKDATQSWRSTVIALGGFVMVSFLAYIKVPPTEILVVLAGVVAALGASSKDSSSKETVKADGSSVIEKKTSE